MKLTSLPIACLLSTSVIPLAKKLDECGVFGVTSDECLNYAMQNRFEWHAKGEQIVKEMVERIRGPKKPVRKAARRGSLGYMARRSATFTIKNAPKSTKSGERKMGDESDIESMDLTIDHLDDSDRSDKKNVEPPKPPDFDVDSDGDDSVVVEA